MEVTGSARRTVNDDEAAVDSVREKVGEYLLSRGGEKEPWATDILNELEVQPDENVANFLAYHIQSEVQKQLTCNNLRQLYDAYVTHGYESVVEALNRKSHGNVVSSEASFGKSIQVSSPLDSPAPIPKPSASSRQDQGGYMRVDKQRRVKQNSSIKKKKAHDQKRRSSEAKREKMKEIEAQIRASQLARYAMRSTTRRKLT